MSPQPKRVLWIDLGEYEDEPRITVEVIATLGLDVFHAVHFSLEDAEKVIKRWILDAIVCVVVAPDDALPIEELVKDHPVPIFICTELITNDIISRVQSQRFYNSSVLAAALKKHLFPE